MFPPKLLTLFLIIWFLSSKLSRLAKCSSFSSLSIERREGFSTTFGLESRMTDSNSTSHNYTFSISAPTLPISICASFKVFSNFFITPTQKNRILVVLPCCMSRLIQGSLGIWLIGPRWMFSFRRCRGLCLLIVDRIGGGREPFRSLQDEIFDIVCCMSSHILTCSGLKERRDCTLHACFRDTWLRVKYMLFTSICFTNRQRHCFNLCNHWDLRMHGQSWTLDIPNP